VQVELDTDGNGFVLFDPETLYEVLGGRPAYNENLLSIFTKTDIGDEVLRRGAMVPIYPLTSGGYNIALRMAGDESPHLAAAPLYAQTGPYCLDVRSEVYLADLVSMIEWEEYCGWQKVDFLGPGLYSCLIRAHQEILPNGDLGEPGGFDVVFERVEALPHVPGFVDVDIDIYKGAAP
jgi:hypothetical protein